MKHFRRILAPTDLSGMSLSAVRYAVHLAKAQNAPLVILHVPAVPAVLYPEALVPVDLSAIVREAEEAAKKKLKHWAGRFDDVAIKVLVRSGSAHETICKVAKEVDASLIVMATHGRTGIGHALLGSITERVLREAPCPVLVVRPTGEAPAKAKRAGTSRAKKAA
jgi:nucleotide-binding universal stress UspA family protein